MKFIFKSIILILLFVSNYQITFAQEGEKEVTITVSGSGKTQEEAKQSALRSAIEQTFGAFISTKTEIFNDQVVADQIASVTSGNIKSFSIINESQLPNGSWGVTLKTLVSLNKLASFVEAKGIAIEIKGGLFALNIKQQLLNEQSEIIAVNQLLSVLNSVIQTSFDYEIKSKSPQSLDDESKNWVIPLEVTAIANKNMEFCANYCLKTLTALGLTYDEIVSYKNLKKSTFPVRINYKGGLGTFYLRKRASVEAINLFCSQWEFYTRLFTVQSGIDTINGRGKADIFKFSNEDRVLNENEQRLNLNFLNSGQKAAFFTILDNRSLSQIEKMSGYSVIPRGVVLQFKYGGILVYEKNGHGLIVSLSETDDLDWESSMKYCDDLIINGNNDWRMPTLDELRDIYSNLIQYNVGFFTKRLYWGSDEEYGGYKSVLFRSEGKITYISKNEKIAIRAVRTF